MFVRSASNASLMACKIVQRQSQFRLLNASAVTFKDNSAIDQAKESAQNLVNKVKETVQDAKEHGVTQTLSEKASETFEHAKESLEHAKESVMNAAKSVGGTNLAEKASETLENAKEKLSDMASNLSHKGMPNNATEAYQKVVQKAQSVKTNVMHGGTTPSAKGKSATYDPRGSQEHVDEHIQTHKKHFSEVDKKLGGTGESPIKGGYDPKTH